MIVGFVVIEGSHVGAGGAVEESIGSFFFVHRNNLPHQVWIFRFSQHFLFFIIASDGQTIDVAYEVFVLQVRAERIDGVTEHFGVVDAAYARATLVGIDDVVPLVHYERDDIFFKLVDGCF